MAETKYGKYLKVATYTDERIGRTVHLYGGKDLYGTDFSPAWVGLTAPLFMMKESHSHPYDEYLFFWGGNAANIEEFDAEVDLSLGDEQELHTITKPTVVYVPKDLKHCPLNFRVVNKPIIFMDISIYPTYTKQ
jgi:hypothetical protein